MATHFPTPVGYAAKNLRRRVAVGLVVAITVLTALAPAVDAAEAQSFTIIEVERRDQLIAAQQALLNVYRCRFEADITLVPGGCFNGAPVSPAAKPSPFDGLPTDEEIAERDRQIAVNRVQLNAYRCFFDIDTRLVPNGCRDGWAVPSAEEPTPQPTESELSPVEVYEQVAPSVALIETSSKLGSGILIEGGYIVTNHHVVTPEDEVWVVFPDGTELRDVPVVGWDFMADLAVLGPVDVQIPPVKLSNQDDLSPGSELLLVGYPSESELFPEPTITRGILSRLRQWDTYGLTVLQSDSAIAGGQSGGALVNSRGEVVGISTWRFSTASFALSTSIADNTPIIEKIILESLARTHTLSEQDTNRRAPRVIGEFEHRVSGSPGIDSPAFTFNATAGTKVTLQINGLSDGFIIVSDSTRTLVTQDGTKTGLERTTFEVRRSGNHFVRIGSNSDEDYVFALTSTIRLRPYTDAFDGTTLLAESSRETAYGYFDYPYDIDWYKIDLEEDQTIEINTDSILADTRIAVRNRETGETVESEDFDPNTGLGFATNAQLRFTAAEDGSYAIIVTERSGDHRNSYALTVERAQE